MTAAAPTRPMIVQFTRLVMGSLIVVTVARAPPSATICRSRSRGG
jgi:hypothetical protein